MVDNYLKIAGEKRMGAVFFFDSHDRRSFAAAISQARREAMGRPLAAYNIRTPLLDSVTLQCIGHSVEDQVCLNCGRVYPDGFTRRYL